MLVKSSAQLRYLSIPPRKMRLVADIVKGLPVEKALGILNFTPKIAAHHLAKTLKSAAANALSKEGTDHLSPEALVIKNIIVDAAPTAKRIRFRSMGRVFRYRKRFCHLTVELEGALDEEVATKKQKPAAAKAAAKDASEPAKKAAKGKSDAKKKPAPKKKTAKTAAKKPTKKSTTSTKTAAKKAGTKTGPKKKKEADK